MAKCGKFMDIKHGSDENGAIAHLWQFADVESQKFYVENVSENLYKITPIHSNKSLEVRDSSFENCAEIAQWDYVDGYDCKLWYIYERENGYFNIVNKNSGKYMDVAGNGIENGTQIWQYEGNDTDAQLFGFIPTEIKFIQGPLVNNIEYVLPKKMHIMSRILIKTENGFVF